MKMIKLTAVAAALAASFGANAELTAMDDAALEAVTGQAGITIATNTGTATVDYAYNDVDGTTGSNSGALMITGSVIDLAGSSLTIDVDAGDALQITQGGTIGVSGTQIGIQDTSTSGAPDFAGTINSIGSVAIAVSNLNSTITIDAQ